LLASHFARNGDLEEKDKRFGKRVTC
jgi:hypothetical protein